MYGVDHCHMLEDRICALDAELARLRAANARLRAALVALNVYAFAPTRDKSVDRQALREAMSDAFRAVEDAGDLR
jgi:anti-sigma factor RsiW